MRTRPLLALVSLLCALPAAGLEPYLVADINPVPGVAGSAPSNFVSLGNVAVFTASDGESLALWRSDGTAAGTWKLADVCATWPACGWVQSLAVAGGRAFFILGTDLWGTDGTVAGTVRLTDGLETIVQETVWVPEQRVLYFPGTDRAHGTELWRTDGTRAGTYLVADLARGPESPQIRTLTAFRGQVWFAAGGEVWRSDGTERGTVAIIRGGGARNLPLIRGVVGRRLLFEWFYGRAGLWATDGTERGTAQLVRLREPILSSVVHAGRLFFTAVSPGRGQELWASDGTARGTRAVSDIPGREAFLKPGSARNLPLPRMSLPGRLLFRAWDPAHGVELWASDGTPAGTRMVRDVCPGPCDGVDQVLLPNQGRFYFAGMDGVHGPEPWASDGTPEGTRMIRDLCPGKYGSIVYTPSLFAGRLLFAADDCEHGFELWTTDGTAAGTVRATDFGIYASVDFFPGAVVGGRYLFAGNDGEHGFEPWSTDGTIAGSALVADIGRADFGGSMVGGIQALGDEAVFFADDGLHGFELWKSDGTAGGTSLVAELSPGPGPQGPPLVAASAEAGGELFLLIWFSDGLTLWRTDGTAAGTIELLGPEAALWDGAGLHAANGRVFFAAFAAGSGLSLWSTDGTVAGTRAVEPEPGKAFSYPIGLTELNGKLYFLAAAADGLYGLWRTDGSAAGTVQVKSLGASSQPQPATAVHAGRLWFTVTAADGPVLWSSDGTAAGTRIEPLPGLPQPDFMVSIGSKLMISGYLPGVGVGLWATDGTPAGTGKVGPVVAHYLGRSTWAVFQGRLVYAAVDETIDTFPKLWTSDGTAAGTGPLLDRDGQRIPPPVDMAVLGDHLIFTEELPAARVWQSDGTPAGTLPLAPERPVGFSTGAVERVGNRVFFGAWEPATGQELWAVEGAHP